MEKIIYDVTTHKSQDCVERPLNACKVGGSTHIA